MYFVMNSRSIPTVHLVNETVIEPPYVHRRRIPHEWIIYIIKKGRMELEEDGILYHLSPGDFLLLSPESQHEGREVTYCEYFYIHFQDADIHTVLENDQQLREKMCLMRGAALSGEHNKLEESGILLPKYCHMSDDAMVTLTHDLYDMMQDKREHMEYYKTLCGSRFLQLLVSISRRCLSNELENAKVISAGNYRRILEVQNYLRASYQEQITGDMLAEHFDMNFDYLNRLFRQSVGRPIFQYLNGLRIARARELLTTTSMRISQISEQVGFVDESYFSKVFKKYTGKSPAEYSKIPFSDREFSSSTYGSASGNNS